jgi:hypothetical protein
MSSVVFQWNATAKLPTDKAVTREDAAAAVDAEATCASGEATKPYGGRSGAYRCGEAQPGGIVGK